MQGMSGQLSSLCFQSCPLAYDMWKRAEQCFEHELGADASFIQFGYWDGLRKRLLAGDRLQADLRRMEVAYLQNARELEIAKHMPLVILDPMPQKFRPFDYSTITDVILHVRYTARDGGGVLKKAAQDAMIDGANTIGINNPGFNRLFSLRQEFPTEWYRFTKADTLQLSPPTGASLQPPSDVALGSLSGKTYAATASIPVTGVDDDAPWTLALPQADVAELQNISDLLLLFNHTLADPPAAHG